jgi:gas vesicle protein
MAYEYDRFEREDGGGSFLMGLLAGTVLGAGLGMLFAPKTGTDLRNQLSEQTGKLKSTANDAYTQASEKVSQMVDRGREAYERARTSNFAGSTAGSSTGSGSGTGTGSTGSSSSGYGTGSGGYGNTGTGGFGSENRG